MPSETKVTIASWLLWCAIALAAIGLARGIEGNLAALFCLGLALITWLKRRELLRERRN